MPGSWGLLPPSQAHQDTPTTPWAGLPVPPGWCARFLGTTTPLAGPSGHSDHPLGRPPRPPRLVCPVLGDYCPPHRPIRILRPPLGQATPSPQAGVPGSWGLLPPSQAHQDTPTTPWAGLPVPPGWCARFLGTTAPLAGPSGHSDHPLGKTPRPPRLVCPVLGDYYPPRRPIRTLRPPPGQDSPSPQAGVPGSWGLLPPSQAHQDTPTTPWAGLPVPPGWCARFLETMNPELVATSLNERYSA